MIQTSKAEVKQACVATLLLPKLRHGSKQDFYTKFLKNSRIFIVLIARFRPLYVSFLLILTHVHVSVLVPHYYLTLITQNDVLI